MAYPSGTGDVGNMEWTQNVILLTFNESMTSGDLLCRNRPEALARLSSKIIDLSNCNTRKFVYNVHTYVFSHLDVHCI